MLELKIICHCGQKYKFDVEPVNGQMPVTVKCPICNLDGTARANELLAQQFALPPKQPYAASPPSPGTIVPTGFAPPPIGYTPPPPPPAPSRAVSSTPPSPAPKPAPVQAAPSSVPAPASIRQSAPKPATDPVPISIPPKARSREPGQFNLILGIVGGLIGALAGCGLVYAIWYWTRVPYLPIGVVAGVLAGYGARWLARGTATTLGIAAAVIAGGAVTGTLFYMGGFVPLSAVSIALGAGVAFMMSSNLMVTQVQKASR